MKHKFPALDGIRGLAVLLVLAAHSANTAFYGTTIISYLLSWTEYMANLGMTAFFVLSGFVITTGYQHLPLFKWSSFVSFFGGRFARLYPLYFATIFFYGGYHYFYSHTSVALAYLTLTQSWFDEMLVFFAPAWSISTECFFYVIFFLALLPLGKILSFYSRKFNIPQGIFFISWLICIILAIIIHGVTYHNLGPISERFHVSQTWLIYFSPLTRVHEFIAGFFLALYTATTFNRNKYDLTIILCGCLFSAYLGFRWYHTQDFGHYLVQNYLFAPLICSVILASIKWNPLSRIFCSSFLVFTGKISYSLYLLQFAVMTVCSAVIPPEQGYDNLIKFACIILFSYVFAYGSYLLIELPAQRLIKSLLTWRTDGTTSSPDEGVIVDAFSGPESLAFQERRVLAPRRKSTADAVPKP